MRWFANDFHSWLRHSWKSLANHLTRDQKIVIHGNSCIILYISEKLSSSKIHGANMEPTWVLSAPGGPHGGTINLAIRTYQWIVALASARDWLIWPVETRSKVELGDDTIKGGTGSDQWVWHLFIQKHHNRTMFICHCDLYLCSIAAKSKW